MKKRVLQFIPSFHQGGSESQAIALTRLLKIDGTFDVFAATLNGEGALRNEIDGIGLAEIPEYPLTSFYDLNFVRQVRRCARSLRENRIDLVHTHDFYTNVFGMAAARLAGVPARITSKRETAGVRSRGQEFVERLAFGQANAIVANCEAVRDNLAERDVTTAKIRVIHNGLELSRFDRPAEIRGRVCRELGLPAGEDIRFITLVANLRHRVKNVPMLLRAAKRIIESVSNVHFVIAGEGELSQDLKEMARKLGVAENVHFIGRCDRIPELLSMTYVCVLTSLAEGFSNSILEYMAAGRPVVATNVGGAAEAVIDGETGFLVDSDDDETMSKRLVMLLENSEKAIGMGEAVRRAVEDNFSTAVQVSKTINLYVQCLSI